MAATRASECGTAPADNNLQVEILHGVDSSMRNVKFNNATYLTK